MHYFTIEKYNNAFFLLPRDFNGTIYSENVFDFNDKEQSLYDECAKNALFKHFNMSKPLVEDGAEGVICITVPLKLFQSVSVTMTIVSPFKF